MLDKRWRAGVERGLAPVGERLRRLGVAADVLTAIGLVISLATAVVIASGHLIWGVVGVILAGLFDLLDGTVARRTGQASPRGSFFDSVADRISDAALLAGVAWYLGRTSPHLPVLAFAVAAASMVISYERAKAESLGLQAKGGLMERAERFVLLSIALAFNVIVPVLWVMLVLTMYTVVDRFRRVWKQAAHAPRSVHPQPRRRVERGDEPPSPRLRTWWEARRPATERGRSRERSVRRTRP
ncbi:MAG: phosphatidylglycerophosphate synthase [Actinomycetia bacterium]|nr:phosphatidylglycerophosphate synthase [Actinomycetes bacterium]